MNFILAPSASRDLDWLSQYFLETNVEAGERLFKALNQRFYNLTQFPNLGKPYSYLNPHIRGLLVENTSFSIALLKLRWKLSELLMEDKISLNFSSRTTSETVKTIEAHPDRPSSSNGKAIEHRADLPWVG